MVELHLDRDSIEREVRRTTEYVGLKAGVFDKVRATGHDTEQIGQWFADALSALMQMLDRVIVGPVEDRGGNVSMCLSSAGSAVGVLEQLVHRYMVANVLVKWLRMVAPELVEPYAADEQRLAAELLNVAHYREMPG